jgi:hypothetical protein
MKRVGFGMLVAMLTTRLAAPVFADDAEKLRNAKTLFFDRQYAEARRAWQAVLAGSAGGEADAAAYWVARCSENLKEDERALGEYGDYLARRPADRALAEEARTSRVGLAARLFRAGKPQHLPVLKEALADPSRTVRYYAALQLSSLGAPAGLPAIPVLQKIVAEEKDEDLVERAKLGLLRLDPGALTRAVPATPPSGHGKSASWIRVRIYEKGSERPEVSVNLPVALAEMVFKSLPDDAVRELKLKGYDAGNFWDRLKALGPTEILKIEGEKGERIEIRLE